MPKRKTVGKILMADSMFLIMAIALIGGATLAGFIIYNKTVVMDDKVNVQLDHLKAYSCEEIIKKHTTAHYLSSENKQFAAQKVESCTNEM